MRVSLIIRNGRSIKAIQGGNHNKNVGGADRVIRILLGIALLALFVVLPGYWKLFGLTAVLKKSKPP
ncbi:YgaP-like transmembrane domain [Paenibacillus physcomitrellae]|uniref:YgaP-like transmembrane domain n=1 Tax=Paenibacillus physcomitrellae TaxID=1619311 RepID=UPI000B8D146B